MVRTRCGGHEPPNQPPSAIATEAPSERALYAAASPAGPAPTIDEVEGVHAGHGHRSVKGCRATGDAALPVVAALAPRLVQEHGRGDRHVEAVAHAQHRQADGCTAGAGPRIASARRPRCPARSPRPAQVDVGVGHRGVDARRDDLHARGAPARSGTAALEPAATGTAKIVPSDARMALGLNRSVRGSAAITASAPARIGGAQHGAQVARASPRPPARRASGLSGRRSPASATSGMRTTATSALGRGRRRRGGPARRPRRARCPHRGSRAPRPRRPRPRPASRARSTKTSTTDGRRRRAPAPAPERRRPGSGPPRRGRDARAGRARPGRAGSSCWLMAGSGHRVRVLVAAPGAQRDRAVTPRPPAGGGSRRGCRAPGAPRSAATPKCSRTRAPRRSAS